MRRGSSGARVWPLAEGIVYKMNGSNPRVAEQGGWLLRHGPVAGLPRVYSVSASSYEMERLVTPPTWALDHSRVLTEMIATLERDVWSQPAEVEFDARELAAKVDRIATRYNLGAPLGPYADAIDWNALPRCLTHGDPTFDNVMFREDTGELVLIDPLPATSAVPDVRAVDYGKILQSCLGYEWVRYRDVTAQFDVTPRELHNYVTPDANEWRATVFWSVVHLVRCVPYAPNDSVRAGLRRLVARAHELT